MKNMAMNRIKAILATEEALPAASNMLSVPVSNAITRKKDLQLNIIPPVFIYRHDPVFLVFFLYFVQFSRFPPVRLLLTY